MQTPGPELREQFLKTIKEQIRSNDPPETKSTFERLIVEGHSEGESHRLLAAVLATEVYKVLKEQLPYDNDRYAGNLNKLPTLPWE
ncbi:MAG: hypothetical protein GY801_30220 [bacterium]|nr:hypothetical protein [bacterium]